MDDWRINNQMDYMFRARLLHTTFAESSRGDHEHCEFCFLMFSNAAEDLHVGYCTLDHYRWLCEGCFRDFKEPFQWSAVNEAGCGRRTEEA